MSVKDVTLCSTTDERALASCWTPLQWKTFSKSANLWTNFAPSSSSVWIYIWLQVHSKLRLSNFCQFFKHIFILLSHCMRFFKTKQQVFKQGEGWEGQNLKSREIFLGSKKSGNWVRFQVLKKSTSSMLQIQVLSDLVQSRGGTFDDLYNRESAGAPDWIRNGSLPLEPSVHYAE